MKRNAYNNCFAVYCIVKIMTKNMMTQDAKEGVSAFLEKRNPIWKNN